jgi:protein phosphatase 1 regulatory subunit 11
MAPPQSHNTRTAAPSTTTHTTTTTQTQTLTPHNPTLAPPLITLRLRGAPSPAPPSDRRIRWAEDVVDNEGLGRKSSKSPFRSFVTVYVSSS